jgi:hypothetical protein
VSQSYDGLSQSVPVHFGGEDAAVHFNWFVHGRSQVIYNGIHHSGGVNHRIEPKGPRHLLLGKVGTGHVNHNFPMRLHQTIRRLATRHRRNNVGVVIDEMFPNRGAKKFGVTVTTESPSIRTSIRPEETKSGEN